LSARRPITNVYIDGFNFYYGRVKGTPYKWLDFSKLLAKALPNNQINKIKYYTAIVNARSHDLDQPVRQQTYIRALKTLSNMTVVLGHFLTTECFMLVAGSPPSSPNFDTHTRMVRSDQIETANGYSVKIETITLNQRGLQGVFQRPPAV
jgi:hypothetical protein